MSLVSSALRSDMCFLLQTNRPQEEAQLFHQLSRAVGHGAFPRRKARYDQFLCVPQKVAAPIQQLPLACGSYTTGMWSSL